LVYTVKGRPQSIQPICAISSNTNNQNTLVWDKVNDIDVDSVKIYKEGISAFTYDLVGVQSASSMSTWIDVHSNVATQAYSYKLRQSGECGLGDASESHRTIHLSISQGVNTTTWNLSWNEYEGINNSGFVIKRGTSPTNMSVIASVPSKTINTYTDINAPSGPLYYQIALADQPTCTPSARLQSGNDFSVQSNIADNGLKVVPANWITISVWPNPSEGPTTSMKVNTNSQKPIHIEIIDLAGRLLGRHIVIGGETNEIGESLPAGSYEIRATLEDGTVARTRFIRVK
jgi:hypothetical protein